MKSIIHKYPITAAIGIGVVLAVLLTMLFAGPAHGPNAKSETVYERVMRTGTLRCGYFSWKPFLIKDPNTGALSGIFYDYVNAIAKKLSLKVEWTQEMGLGEFSAALDSGIVDGFCSGAYITGARARAVDFVSPAFYVPLYAFERADDARFDHGIDALNDSQFRMAILDRRRDRRYSKTTISKNEAQFIAAADKPRRTLHECFAK